MIAFLAGFVGVGKTSLAQVLSNKTGYLHFDIDEVKKQIFPIDPDYEKNMRLGIPFSYATKRKVFDLVVEDFARLSVVHSRLIVDETFHKRALREIAFEGAKLHFGGYILVWVTANEDTVRNRLLKGPREGHILNNPMGMYRGIKKQFEPFTEPHIKFENSLPLAESGEQLYKILKERGF